ncbi:tetratricopeptide repeat protein [Parasphingorhabdus sp.]|uniref:tetratricopeptide repeat protein n=1 Tax=Parasphingorhabdus sp. TaxID=2709688 RepID=UPI003299CA70
MSDDHVAAAEIYRERLKAQPQNTLIAQKSFVKAMEIGDFELARTAVRLLKENGELDAEMPLVLFTDAFAKRDWRAASNAVLELETGKNFAFLSPILQMWLDVATKQNGYLSLSLIQENKTARYYYQEQEILYQLARGKPALANPLIKKIVQQNDARMSPIRIMVARHYLALGRVEDAKNTLKNKGTAPEARLLQTIDTGDFKKMSEKVTAQTGLAFVFQRLAADLGTQQAPFLALVSAQMSAHIAPKSSYGHLILARRYADADIMDSALKEFTRVDTGSPYLLVALNALLANLVQKDQFDRALQQLGAVITAEPDSPQLYLLKGQVLQLQSFHGEAAQAFKHAISLAEAKDIPDRVLANYWLSLGGAQEQAGIWPEGLQSLKTANRLSPQSPSILNYLGYAQLERRENTQEAVAAIKEAFELRSTSPAITDSLGWAYFLTGQHDKAVQYLERALAGEPQDPTINEHLGDAYWTVGRKYEARYAWKSAKLFAEDDDHDRLSKKIDLGLLSELVSP